VSDYQKQTYYQLLKISPNADINQIINAYHEISKKLSILPYSSNNEIKSINIDFIEYKKAYEILTDPEERRKYDLELGISQNMEIFEEHDVNPQTLKTHKISLNDTLIRLTFSKKKLDSKDIEEFKLERIKRKFGKAKKYIEMERYHEAIKLLREVISIDFKVADYHSLLGFALLKKGWENYAQIEFKIAIEIDPINEIATHYFKYISPHSNENEEDHFSRKEKIKNYLVNLFKHLRK
jgi:curved DNA-binding protein CbpA